VIDAGGQVLRMGDELPAVLGVLNRKRRLRLV
jgi:hypothetical protein